MDEAKRRRPVDLAAGPVGERVARGCNFRDPPIEHGAVFKVRLEDLAPVGVDDLADVVDVDHVRQLVGVAGNKVARVPRLQVALELVEFLDREVSGNALLPPNLAELRLEAFDDEVPHRSAVDAEGVHHPRVVAQAVVGHAPAPRSAFRIALALYEAGLRVLRVLAAFTDLRPRGDDAVVAQRLLRPVLALADGVEAICEFACLFR